MSDSQPSKRRKTGGGRKPKASAEVEEIEAEVKPTEAVEEVKVEELPKVKTQLNSSDFCIDGDKLIYSNVLCNKSDSNHRWIDRMGSYYIPSAPFIYELNYAATNNPSALTFGFDIQWQYLPYSLRDTSKYILYGVIKSLSDISSNIVCVGDIVLKLNDEIVFYKPGDTIDHNKLDDKFQRTSGKSYIIRLLRCSGNAGNLTISPAELTLYAQEKSITAKFLVSQKRVDSTKLSLDQMQMDATAPPAIKRMMQGGRVAWEGVPVYQGSGAAAARATHLACVNTALSSSSSYPSISTMVNQYCTMIFPNQSVHDITSGEEAVQRGEILDGVYREKNRFVAILADPIPGDDGTKKLYNLGRFDTDEDAARAYNKARRLAESSGGFSVPKYVQMLKQPLFGGSSSGSALQQQYLTAQDLVVPFNANKMM